MKLDMYKVTSYAMGTPENVKKLHFGTVEKLAIYTLLMLILI